MVLTSIKNLVYSSVITPWSNLDFHSTSRPEIRAPLNRHQYNEILRATTEPTQLDRRDPGDPGTEICVKYAATSPDNVQDVIQWFKDWSAQRTGYMPDLLLTEFGIPTAAFDCPGPTKPAQSGQSETFFACILPTEDFCFNGKGDEADLKMAWEVLNLVARYRVSRNTLESIYAYTLTAPEGDNYGMGVVRDFARVLKDFYNGAFGDSPMPATDLVNLVGIIFFFAPHDISKSTTLYAANLAAMKAADEKAFKNCMWYDLGISADCLNKPGLNAVWGYLNKFRKEFDTGLNWIDVVSDMATHGIPLYPDANLIINRYKTFHEVFIHAAFMQLQRQQLVFMHAQQYDLDPNPGEEDDLKPYWGASCRGIISSITGGACKDSKANPDDHQSMAYYPVQITGKNNTLSRDYPAFETVSEYGWDPHQILGQSERCAEVKGQSYNLQPAYPQIFDVARDQANGLAWIAAADSDTIDHITCLWSLPSLHFTEGPHYNGLDKFKDTLKNLGSEVLSLNSMGMDHRSDRVKWKDDSPRDYKVWNIVRGTTDYCPAPFNLVEGLTAYFHFVGIVASENLGWGIEEAADQVVADIWAAQQIVRPNTNASLALDRVHDLACEKQAQDTDADVMKTIYDALINIAAAELTGGTGNWLAGLLLQSETASVAQTLLDDFYLQPWLDGVLKKQFYFEGESKKLVLDYLSPHFKTNKLGDGVDDPPT